MGTSSPRYTAEFKQKAVELYKRSGTTYAEVARGLARRHARVRQKALGREARLEARIGA